ncbi:MAG: flagellar motor stator protein MotA [Acidobacteria bacterium]|nr:flagellar motor stator protein MotA [Acidobacteriota bacterium]
MFAIIGIVIVFGSVIGGYLMAHGHLEVLFQPNELVVICGAALGSMLVANPLPIVIGVMKGLIGVLKGSPYNKAMYLENLKMLNAVFTHARKNGLVKLEADVDEPDKSQVFSQFPNFLKNHAAVGLVCDTLRTAISGGIGHHELDQVMEQDIEIHAHEQNLIATALNTTADAFPGLGIVAAVLGVIVTMGALGGPPEQIGHHVAAALVGTFLGILLCYGILGPLASNMTKIIDCEKEYLLFLRAGVMAFVRGAAPILASEIARRAIPHHERPSFKEMEEACRGGAK